jgi:uncharacterized membrane protein YgcG
MDSTTTPAVDRRRAHRRVGTAAVLAFAALLALGLGRNAAQADPAIPEVAPAVTATPTPEQSVPRQVMPFIPGRDHDGDGDRFRGGDPGGGGGFGGGGGGTAPAPSTGGTSGGNQT